MKHLLLIIALTYGLSSCSIERGIQIKSLTVELVDTWETVRGDDLKVWLKWRDQLGVDYYELDNYPSGWKIGDKKTIWLSR